MADDLCMDIFTYAKGDGIYYSYVKLETYMQGNKILVLPNINYIYCTVCEQLRLLTLSYRYH